VTDKAGVRDLDRIKESRVPVHGKYALMMIIMMVIIMIVKIRNIGPYYLRITNPLQT
jgi:hypothetical protein